MKKALIVTTNNYPTGDAGAIRKRSFALMLKELDYSPLIVGMGPPTSFRIASGDVAEYISLRSRGTSIATRVADRMLYATRLKKFLEHSSKWDAIIVDDIPSLAMKELRRYADKHGTRLLHDSVEWYSPSEFTLRRLSPSYRHNNRLNTRAIKAPFRVIAISKYLEEHFRSRGVIVGRIPAILNVSEYRWDKNSDDEVLRIVYAGTPGRKDYLVNFLEAAAGLEERDRLRIHIIGTTLTSVLSLGVDPESVGRLGHSLQFSDRLPRESVLEILREADFTIMFREAEARYAMAGFPTKFSESMATGTPMILNWSSDISFLAADNEQVIVAGGGEIREIKQALRRALSLSVGARRRMGSRARLCAEEHLDYRRYIGTLGELLQ